MWPLQVDSPSRPSQVGPGERQLKAGSAQGILAWGPPVIVGPQPLATAANQGPVFDTTCLSHSSNTQAHSQVTTSWPHPCSLLWSPRPRVTLFGAQNILEQ